MASKIKKHRRREETAPAVVTDKIPLVSVIIPMYNSAKFITQTLESLAYQTMKDFEVVVVDDCSTDNSVEVVENFANRVGRGLNLHVIKLPKNTGTPGLPRNVGIQFARGKYIAFLDSDDLYTKTALEELTTLAEKYQADAINIPACFSVEDKGSNTDELLNPANHTVGGSSGKNSPWLKEPVELPEDTAERVKFWLDNKFFWATCSLFCRRDFLTVNQIAFPDMMFSEDQIVQISCLLFAKNVLIVPNIIYIARRNLDSLSRKNIPLEKYFHKWLSSLNKGFNEFNGVMNRVPFFAEHPDYRYAVLEWFFDRTLKDAWQFHAAYRQIPPFALNELVEKEFHPDDAALSAYLFNTVNIHRLQLMKLQQENIALRNELQKYQTAQ